MVDFRIEIVVLPVTDVDRAREFYTRLGFREDAEHTGPDGFRLAQFTPPGSAASIIVGTGVTEAAPGSARGVYLVVDDIVTAHEDLVARGVEVSEILHDAGGVFHHAGTEGRVPGPHPDRQSYGSFLSFRDPTATSSSCRRSPPGPRAGPGRAPAAQPRSGVRRGWTTRWLIRQPAGVRSTVSR